METSTRENEPENKTKNPNEFEQFFSINIQKNIYTEK